MSTVGDNPGISRRECPPSVHARNQRFVKRELRSRGIAITPESDPVVRLPAGSNWNTMDVKMVLRTTLKASYIPLCVCDFILEHLRVIRQVPPSVGRMIDNCMSWTGRINASEPVLCGCATFQWLPKRHGHVFCPSWEYTGPYVVTINANTKRKGLPGWQQQDMEAAVAVAWLRWLPGSLLSGLRGLGLLVNSLPVSYKYFSLREVSKCKTVLAPMVVTLIDKCNQCLLIW